MTRAVWLKYSIGLKCLEREAFCLFPSLWLFIKLMGWRQEGRRKAPRTATVMEAGLGVMESGWVWAKEVLLSNLLFKPSCWPIYSTYKRRDHNEAPSWNPWRSCINSGLQTGPFASPSWPPAVQGNYSFPSIVPYRDPKPRYDDSMGDPFLHRLSALKFLHLPFRDLATSAEINTKVL